MSSFYNLEPQTTAKVLMHTTAGDLELELWATQCPLTCRNFLQLCLDGYYDNTIFHRLVPGFIVQGGDPTGTGHGGEAIYPGGLFADEFHSRLKYNRRGLLGMANSGKPDDNGSQFFFTLGDTKELTGKNTLFGKVVGDTIYNLVKIGEMELEEEGSERMLYPVKIKGTEILVNPFEDVVKRDLKRKQALEEKETAPKKAAGGKKKGAAGKKGKALLSFGGDEEEDGEPVMPVKKMKFDSRLISAVPEEEEQEKPKAASIKPRPAPAAASTQKSDSSSPSSSRSSSPAPPPPPKATKPSKPTQTTAIPSRSSSPEPSKSKPVDSYLTKTNAQIEALKASLKRGGSESAPPPPPQAKKRSLLALQKAMLPSTSIKGRKRRRNGKGKGAEGDFDDEEAMDALERFKLKLAKASDDHEASTPGATASTEAEESSVPAPTATTTTDTQTAGKEGDEEEEYQLCDLHFIPHCQSCKSWDEAHNNNPKDNDLDEDIRPEDFLGHTLRFEKDRLGKDLNWKKDHEYDDGLVVIDPREKGRELAEKRGGKGKFGSGSGSGGRGGREWDRDKGGRDRRGVSGPSGSGSRRR